MPITARGGRALWVAALLLLVGCDHTPAAPTRGDTAGDALEAAAIARGIVTDPARVEATGLYGRGDDRMCVLPDSGTGTYRIGVLVRYDEAHGCTARGTAVRMGDRLDVDLGDTGDCRFAARFEGDRIVFPADLPAVCDRRCTGRASLGALAVERLSDGAIEASARRGGNARPPCA